MMHSASRVLTSISKWIAIIGIALYSAATAADTTLTIVFDQYGKPTQVTVDGNPYKSCGSVSKLSLYEQCGGTKHPVEPISLWSISFFKGEGSYCGWVNINGFLYWMCK